jgi:hypothetical protein
MHLLASLLDRRPRRKSDNNISQTKTSVGGLNKAFFNHLRKQNGDGEEKKGVKMRVFNVMGQTQCILFLCLSVDLYAELNRLLMYPVNRLYWITKQ